MTNQKRLILATMVVAIFAIGTIGLSYAQEDGTIPNGDTPIVFTEAHGLVIVVGALGGLTSAYLGSRKAKASSTKEKPYSFNIHRFLDRVVIAVITSVTLAITAATGFMELNFVTLFLIYVAAIGTAQLTLEVRNRNG